MNRTRFLRYGLYSSAFNMLLHLDSNSWESCNSWVWHFDNSSSCLERNNNSFHHPIPLPNHRSNDHGGDGHGGDDGHGAHDDHGAHDGRGVHDGLRVRHVLL